MAVRIGGLRKRQFRIQVPTLVPVLALPPTPTTPTTPTTTTPVPTPTTPTPTAPTTPTAPPPTAPTDVIGNAIAALIASSIGGGSTAQAAPAQAAVAQQPYVIQQGGGMAGLPKFLLIVGLALLAWWLYTRAKKSQEEAGE